MADQAVAEKVQEMFDQLLGNKAEAEAFSEDPEKWVEDKGYGDLPADAVAECGVQYGSGATAVASSGGGYSPGVAGVAQAAAPSVYNTYIDDNSITNNIANNGIIQIGDDNQAVQGDGNVVAGDDINNQGGQIQTGSGIQAGNDVDIDDSAVSTGSGDASNISDIDDSDLTNVNQGDAGGDINQADVDDSVVNQGGGAAAGADVGSEGVDVGDVDVDAGP
jgi:hypothetical protein